MRHELRCCTAVRHGLRYCTARDELLKSVPYIVALVRALLSRSLPRNASPCHTAYTLRAAGEPDVLPDVVVCAGDALFLAAAGGVVFPSCSRGWAAGGAVLVKMAAGNAAAAAAAVPMRTTVVTSPRVAAAAAAIAGASVADVLADGGPHHRRGARLTACPFCLCHGFHPRSRFGHFPRGQRLTRGTGRSCLILIDASRHGSAQAPILPGQNLPSSQAQTSHSEIGGSSCSLRRVLFPVRTLLYYISQVS